MNTLYVNGLQLTGQLVTMLASGLLQGSKVHESISEA